MNTRPEEIMTPAALFWCNEALAKDVPLVPAIGSCQIIAVAHTYSLPAKIFEILAFQRVE